MKPHKRAAFDDSGNSDPIIMIYLLVLVFTAMTYATIYFNIINKTTDSTSFIVALAAAPIFTTLTLGITIYITGLPVLLIVGGLYNLINRKSTHKWSTQAPHVSWAFRIVYDLFRITPAETVRTGTDSPFGYYELRRYEEKGQFRFGESIYSTPTNTAELCELMRHCHTSPTWWRPFIRPIPALIRAVALTGPQLSKNANIIGHTRSIKNSITGKEPQAATAAALVGYHYSNLPNWGTYHALYGHVQHGWLLALAGITSEEAKHTQPDAETLKLLAALQGHPMQEINQLLST